ncbi:PH domain-containing protein [Aeromicrobium fastidiosum]|uniref:PH domain-containing protein n=1 Tax=Aeromicrobium fastidiosum TaxID=52699 RepID=A0A641AGR0_9ACTN|nr:PH domain-containing protein [Aeromicrobium fastidiosum]KAA1372441.1 PH domain-containing protein [Aeromicrobium fastidiosum]MBP2391485.1 putative membrane protein [Aeromicrobium fastidiosum]
MEQVSDPSASETVGRRTHPLTAVVQGARFAVAVVVGLVGTIFGGDSWGDIPAIVSLGIALVAGLVVGVAIGYVGWLFTRYVIDGTELRINTGLVTKSSRRIPYERIQSVDIAEPLVARVLGLAELRIEMAGGKDSRSTLKFLTLADARDLRRVLMARAHGESLDEPREEHRSIITRVPPERVVIGTLLSLDFLFAAIGSVVLLVLAVWFVGVLVLLGGIIPLATWLAQIVAMRVLQQWNFTLSRGERGLRIERGLLSRTSQTIPFDRVQGIAIKEPFVWRRLGWQRLEVDIAGYASHGEDERDSSSSILLPIADRALAAAVIAELVSHATADVEHIHAPRRSRLFAPIGWRYRWVGADAAAFVAHEGWIQQTTSIVPHQRTQSVELRQGPLQRRRKVATVEVHTPEGPVDADGRHLDEHDARAVLLAQLERARSSRA